jgi:hypothetical protein
VNVGAGSKYSNCGDQTKVSSEPEKGKLFLEAGKWIPMSESKKPAMLGNTNS